MQHPNPALDFENLARVDFNNLVSPITVQVKEPTRKLAQARRKPASPLASKPHSPQRKRVMVRKTMTLPTASYQLGSFPHDNQPPNSPRRKTRKEAILPPSAEMRKLPSSRSASPKRNSSGTIIFQTENKIDEEIIKKKLIFEARSKASSPLTTIKVPVQNSANASSEISQQDTSKIPSNTKRRTPLKGFPGSVPLEKLEQLQELLKNQNPIGHIPKKVRKILVTPSIALAAVPTSIKKIDPERAAKGKQYIKDRKAQDLKKKRLLAEKERVERERVASALKKIEEIRKEQRKQAKEAKATQKVPTIPPKTNLNSTAIRSEALSVSKVENTKQSGSKPDFKSPNAAEVSSKDVPLDQSGLLPEIIDRQSELNPNVAAVPESQIPNIPADGYTSEKSLIIEELKESFEASKAVPDNITKQNQPDVSEMKNELSAADKDALQDRLFNMHRHFVLVAERLELFEEALAARESANDADHEPAPELITSDIDISENHQENHIRTDEIVGVGNLLEFSKRRKDDIKKNEAALKIQMFYKKQRFRKGLEKKRRSKSKSPHRIPGYSKAEIQDLLLETQSRPKIEIDKALISAGEYVLNSASRCQQLEKKDDKILELNSSPIVKLSNFLGLSGIKESDPVDVKAAQLSDNKKIVEEIPFAIPKNFKHSIINLYAKYIARSGKQAQSDMNLQGQTIPNIQPTPIVPFDRVPIQPDTNIINLEGERSKGNCEHAIVETMDHRIPMAARTQSVSKEIQTDVILSAIPEPEALSISQATDSPIISPISISKSHSLESVNAKSSNAKSNLDYENDSFESMPSVTSDVAPNSPPLKQRVDKIKTFTPGDVLARQKRDMMGVDGFSRLAPQALGKKFDLELQAFLAVDAAVQEATEIHKTRSAAIFQQENDSIAELHLRQDQFHASELEKAKRNRTSFVPDILSQHNSKDNIYEDSFESISDIPEPKVISRAAVSRHHNSELFEELIESVAKPSNTAQNISYDSCSSIEELIERATSYVSPKKPSRHNKDWRKKDTQKSVGRRAHNDATQGPSLAEIQLEMKLAEIKQSDSSSNVEMKLKMSRPRSPVSDVSSISEYVPKDSESAIEIIEYDINLKSQMEIAYDNESFYSMESESSLTSKSKIVIEANQSLKKQSNTPMSDSANPLLKTSEESNKSSNGIVTDLQATTEKPPSNRNSKEKPYFHKFIDFDELSGNIQDISDDLSSFQEDLLKAGRSPSRTVHQSSPEKANFLDPNHPMAIGNEIVILATAENNDKIRILQQDLLYWESKRKIDELNEQIRLTKEGTVTLSEDISNSLNHRGKSGDELNLFEPTRNVSDIMPETVEKVVAGDNVTMNEPAVEPHSAEPQSLAYNLNVERESVPAKIDRSCNAEKETETQIIVSNSSKREIMAIVDPEEGKKALESKNSSAGKFFALDESPRKSLIVASIGFDIAQGADKQTDSALLESVLEVKNGMGEEEKVTPEEIYESDFEDFESSGSAESSIQTPFSTSALEECVHGSTLESFDLNIQLHSSSPIAKLDDLPIDKVSSTDLVDSLTDSIFFDLLQDSVKLAISMAAPAIATIESPVLVNQIPDASINVLETPSMILDYDKTLADGCESAIQILENILPQGAYYWEAPKVTSAMLSRLPSLVRELVVDCTNEALYEQFEKHRSYDDPRTNFYQKRTVKPAKVSKNTLISYCSAKFNSWRLHSIRHGTNLDSMLIDTVKSEGKILCNILNDEVLVKNRLFEEIWNDLIVDTARSAMNIGLI